MKSSFCMVMSQGFKCRADQQKEYQHLRAATLKKIHKWPFRRAALVLLELLQDALAQLKHQEEEDDGRDARLLAARPADCLASCGHFTPAADLRAPRGERAYARIMWRL